MDCGNLRQELFRPQCQSTTARTSRFILSGTQSAVDGDNYKSLPIEASNKLFSSIILSAGDTVVLSVFQALAEL